MSDRFSNCIFNMHIDRQKYVLKENVAQSNLKKNRFNKNYENIGKYLQNSKGLVLYRSTV